MKDRKRVVNFVQSFGPEMMPNPNVEGKISAGLMRMPGVANLGLRMMSDDDTDYVSAPAIETFMGHYPAGTSFRCVEHFRQMMLAEKY